MISRLINAREIMLVTNKLEIKFVRNELIFANIRKRTSAKRIARSRSITFEQNYVVRIKSLIYRKMTFLELCVTKQIRSINSIDE